MYLLFRGYVWRTSAATIQESPWQAYMTELLLIGFNVLRIIIGCNTMKPTAKLKRNQNAHQSTKSS